MHNKSSISVVIPTYNRADLLIKAIESVLCQQHEADEILVCDDGSTDNSMERVQALNNPKIRWIDCGRNGRPAIPRNIGIKNAKSYWVAFLDSDDVWLPHKLKEQISLLKTTSNRAVCSNAFKVRENEEQAVYFDFPDTEINLTSMLLSNKVICSSMMVERTLLTSVGMFPEDECFKAIEDYDLWIRISAFTKISYIKDPLVLYRDEPNQSIRQADKTLKQQRLTVFEDIVKWIELNGPENKTELIDRVKAELVSLSDNSFKTRLWRFKNLLYQKLKK